MRDRFSKSPLVAALVLALWVAAPLAMAAHTAHVHRYCPEHLTFEEVGAAAEAPITLRTEVVSPAVDPVAPIDQLVTVAPGATPSTGDHQACPIQGAARSIRAPLRSSLWSLAVHWVTASRPLGSAFPQQPIPLLTAAPKSSPPA